MITAARKMTDHLMNTWRDIKMFILFLVILFCSSFIHSSNKPEPKPTTDWWHVKDAPYVVSRPATPEPGQQSPLKKE